MKAVTDSVKFERFGKKKDSWQQGQKPKKFKKKSLRGHRGGRPSVDE